MEAFNKRLIARAATIDELLSDGFAPQPGAPADSDVAATRMAAWCRSSANGDAGLFRRRLERDGLSYDDVLKRLTPVDSDARTPGPAWLDDAVWIESALQSGSSGETGAAQPIERHAFEHLLGPLVEQADTLLWSAAGEARRERFTEAARTGLRRMLLDQLTDLCAPPLYEAFSAARGAMPPEAPPAGGEVSTALYDRYVADMKAGGFRRLFEDKPVLLRLIATLTRQWIEAVREFASRLDADIEAIRRELIGRDGPTRVARIDGDLSDRHNGGRSVFIVTFEDGARAVYKPKDLRLDVAWNGLIARLNASSPPLDLRAAGVIARDHYGWTEFIEHAGTDLDGCAMYFRRAGAWLALFHCFAATDMHQENIIAAGDQPVPIDLETILQPPGPAPKAQEVERAASDAAADMIVNSVMAVGILPAYGRAPDTSVFAMGALTADWNSKVKLTWIDINTDGMRPTRTTLVDKANPNLPHVDGRYARFGDHIDAFVAGFEDYARFLSRRTRDADQGRLFDGFAGAPVRKVVRPTRFYSMLLQRLKAHRSMTDGATWSAQADFIARLSDWDAASDPNWPFHRAERAALLALNVPHFVLPSDGHTVSDFAGPVATIDGQTAVDRARSRLREFDEREIAWQTAVIRANTTQPKPSGSAETFRALLKSDVAASAAESALVSEADRIAGEISEHAVRRGVSAAWIGLDWMGDAEAFQLAPLGPDLYNGVSGIAVFLAAHSAVASHAPSAELALAALSHLRKKLKDRNAARFARSLGIGGATGLGSLVYALTVISRSLDNADLLADAHVASTLITDDLIAADKRLDALGGSAGAILGLLRLYRDTKDADVLARAVRCGEHLLRQERVGPEGRRSWVGHGLGHNALNGMSHGAAGFALALASLAAASGRADFQQAAAEALAFENSTYDAGQHNWPDRRHADQPGWACRWCHGAPGIGLARVALLKQTTIDPDIMRRDIRNALAGVDQAWPTELDTLCCGTLGNVEFLCEAGEALGRPEIRQAAADRLAAVVQAAGLTGDYRWNSGKQRFNLGLFRGLAGVGYTLLRQRDDALPNILIWE